MPVDRAICNTPGMVVRAIAERAEAGRCRSFDRGMPVAVCEATNTGGWTLRLQTVREWMDIVAIDRK